MFLFLDSYWSEFKTVTLADVLTVGIHIRMRGEELHELRPQRHRAPWAEAEPPLDTIPTVGTGVHVFDSARGRGPLQPGAQLRA
jgi:hypothetical protein